LRGEGSIVDAGQSKSESRKSKKRAESSGILSPIKKYNKINKSGKEREKSIVKNVREK
jgi:hypothetical protein